MNGEMMLKRVVLVSVLFGCASFGCGLRVEPESPDGGTGTGGTGGSVSPLGTAGRGGATGRGGSVAGSSGGSIAGSSGGSIAGSGGSAGDAGVDCTPGSACLPTNPCHVGQTTCSAVGEASCTDTQTAQPNGIVCGMNMVCNDGACVACAAGTACAITTNACRIGAVVCSTGVGVCTETADKPNGTSCGTGMVCQAGRCVACQENATCSPTNACHQGALACSTGTPTCTDKGTNVVAGTSCAQDKVCNATGVCGDCRLGAICAVTAKPCRTGTTACSTGAPVCVESANVANGTSCGTNMVCSSGICMPCTTGLACTPANPCHAGTQACAPAITCADTGRNLANGTTCGTNMVCNNGACGICTAGVGCQPSNRCKTGTTSCVTGVVVCAETGNVANGTSCGTNGVCNNGTCSACTAGSSCPTNPTSNCKNGTTSCSTGAMTCVDGTNKANGTPCGTNMVCSAGTCRACTAGTSCPTNPTSNCKNGATSCLTGTMTCVDAGNKPNGSSCGTNMVCNNGGCGACTIGTPCATNPMSNCKNGTTACSTGTTTCVDGGNKANGTPCGTNLVCNNGTCGACTIGTQCATNPGICRTGTTSCSTGTMTCVDGGNKTAGTACGSNMVCNGSGTCVACTAGNTCTGNPNLCKIGTTSCSTGAMTCVDSTSNKAAGTSCGTGMVCNANGMCGACTPNQSCTNNPDPCFTGVTACTSGSMACNNDMAKTLGASCGTNKVCNSTGACVACTMGMACTGNPSICKSGTISCTTGAPICLDGANKPPGASCGAPQSCMGDTLTSAEMCDGAGACTSTTDKCPGSATCNAAMTDCEPPPPNTSQP